MEKVRIGIIGAGGVVESRHLPGLEGVEGVEIDSIWSRDLERAGKVAQEHGIGRVRQEWEDIVRDGGIDAVIVAAPPVLHAVASIAGLEEGKHVLCQGRMARNLREAGEMVAAAEKAEKVAALYPPRPGLKGDRVVQRLLGEGYVGEVREVRVSGMSLVEVPDIYRWMDDPEVVGVNSMALGLWAEVLNRWVGPATRVAAVAQMHGQQRMTPAGEQVAATVPDTLAVVAQLECGATASYHFSTAAAFGPGSFIEIYGTRGALVYEMFADQLRGATEGDGELQVIVVEDPPAPGVALLPIVFELRFC